MYLNDFENYEDFEEYLSISGWINLDVIRYEWPYYEEEAYDEA